MMCFLCAGESTPELWEAQLAIIAAARIACPLNPRGIAADVSHAVNICKPCLVLVDAFAAPFVATSGLLARVPCMYIGSHDSEPPNQRSVEAEIVRHWEEVSDDWSPEASPCGTAFICFTSGTSAKPKGVAITHTALHVQSLAKLAALGYCAEDIYLHTAPLFHVGAVSCLLAQI